MHDTRTHLRTSDTGPVYVGRSPRVTAGHGTCNYPKVPRPDGDASYTTGGGYAPRHHDGKRHGGHCSVYVDNYYQNTPLWGTPYRYCRSDRDCAVNTLDATRCFAIDPAQTPACTSAALGSCICSNSVRGPF